MKKILIVKQIFLVSTLGNVERIVGRKCILMLKCKGLNYSRGSCSLIGSSFGEYMAHVCMFEHKPRKLGLTHEVETFREKCCEKSKLFF